MDAKKRVGEFLSSAGIELNGIRAFDLQVFDERFYNRVLAGGSLAAGESFMDGWWDSDKLDELVSRFYGARVVEHFQYDISSLMYFLRAHLFNLQTSARAPHVARAHYDLGNDLYERMLGPSMAYTCGYWSNAENLTDAQYAKFDLVCRKIGLRSGQRILDIGCGFGSFAKYAAERYGASVVGVSLSKEQISYARELTRGLPIEIRYQDYRDVSDEPFDHIVSIGMFEAVGYRNYETFMKKAHSLLKKDGLFLLHTIGVSKSLRWNDPWMDKYIFPNGHLPSVEQIGRASADYFVIEDWHNFGADYDKTLMAWHENFVKHWPELKDKYGERFYRMWVFYLLSCAGLFRARYTQLWQVIFSKSGVQGGYVSVR